MYKNISSLIIASALGTFFSGYAVSAPIANLKVAGDIKPPTCTVNGVLNEGDVEFKYAPISPRLIPTTKEYALPKQEDTLNVVCDATTYLTFSMSDVYPISNYVDRYTASHKYGVYGLVDPLTNKEVGGISFVIENPQVDGVSAYISQVGTGDWSATVLVKDRVIGWTKSRQDIIANVNQLNLMPGKLFSAQIRSNTNIGGYSFIKSTQVLAADGIDISEGFDFVGQAIMSFNFGI